MVNRLLLWLVVTSAAVASWLLTAARLPFPPILDPVRIPAWWTEAGPIEGTGSLLRLFVLTWVGTWSARRVVGAFRELVHLGRTFGRQGWLRIRSTRGFARLALSLTSSGGVFGACSVGGSAASAPTAPVLAGPDVPGSTLRVVDAAPASHATTGDPRQLRHSGVRAPAPARREVPPLGPSERPHPAPPATWTVHAGDDFWSIAENVVSRRSPTSVSGREVATYWSRLIAANRGRLPEPGDPDLLFPGDTLVLPPI